MTKWEEMIQSSFISGTKLPKEIKETIDNYKVLQNACKAAIQAKNNIDNFKNRLSNVIYEYKDAQDELNIDKLRELNKEAEFRNSEIEKSFKITLNGLSMKEEGETEKEMEERVINMFKLPITK